MMYTTTTTTAAPVWATNWAIMPELPTTAPAIIESKRESRAALLWRVLKDYAAGTWLYTIKPAAAKFGRKVAKVATRAALYLFRFVWFAAILCATFGTLAALVSAATDVLPHFWPLRLVAFFVIAAAAVGVELLLIAGTRRIDNATENRLFAMH